MARSFRNAAAAVLVVAVAIAPALLDHCFERCATHPAALASTPACHHATASGTRIGHVPPRCTHDHGGDANVVVKSVAPNPTAVVLVAVLEAGPAAIATDNAAQRFCEQSPPGSSLVLNAQSLPLRI